MNQITLVLAMFTHLGLMTKDQAKKLYENMRYETVAEDYDTCYALVETMFEKAKIGVTEIVKDIEVDGKPLAIKK